ncbi:maltotransferase domain-containing protein [Amycolatopsis sp. CA-128772]|uniref:maltotransferase domain-containing protein n=1 Tax=Amycolatopsis sp. CA-128772 TaxID=2073159 RepID=UPI000CD2D8D7|nr:maltotransferase domain-containing protein [Amycolatopsis sp. CA-128772]
MVGRIVIEDVCPTVGTAEHPAKAVVGEAVRVSATVWAEGTEAVAAAVVLRWPDGSTRRTRLRPDGDGGDSFAAIVVPDEPGVWTFRIDAWSEPWAAWERSVRAKVAAGLGAPELANDFEVGARLLERVAYRPDRRAEREALLDAANALRSRDLLVRERLSAALSEYVLPVMREHPVREHCTRGRVGQLRVDRVRAGYGAWYEFFPRSTGGTDSTGRPVHGTFATATAQLDRIASMGFDVVYLPPVHPIGTVHRKGRNNSVVSADGDVGSPWAIGSAEGGHDAIEPKLGTFTDFDAFVARARELGLEVALDLALQCAPDHPWVHAHPQWFSTLPDGTIACAENPPKRYEDILPLNFDQDPEGLYTEVRRIVELWVRHGVRIFRVDNPHTKPPAFWHRLIRDVQETHPDVLFLAEAFTRPARLYGLARLGFSQSYTYFTWRTGKAELTEFGRELVGHADEARPNLFVTTPDILPAQLQTGNPAAFAARAALAATLSPTWGVYSGFELYEHEAIGAEEYRDSEKYELRPRDYATALAEGRSLQPWLARLNEIRRAHPALQQLRTLLFHHVDNDHLIAYSKTDPAGGDTVLCVLTLDHCHTQEGTVHWDFAALGLSPEHRYTVHDEVSGELFEWGRDAYVKLDPHRSVAHIGSVGPA